MLLDDAGRPAFKPREDRVLSAVKRKWSLAGRQSGTPWEPVPFNGTIAWRHNASLDLECLIRAVEQLIARHDVLRCSLDYSGGEWRLAAEKAAKFQLHVLDGPESRDQSDEHALALLNGFIWRPFDLQSEAPLRTLVVRISEERFLIALTVHHSFADAYSVRIFSDELWTTYQVFRTDQPCSLPKLPMRYLDYLASMEEWLKGAQARTHAIYWSRYLDDVARMQPSLRSNVEISSFRLSGQVAGAARRLCDQERLGANLLWEGVHHIALAQLLVRSDVTSLSIDVGRRQPELLRLVGEFHNCMPHRSHVSPDLTFAEFLRQIRDLRAESVPYISTPHDLIDSGCPFVLASEFGMLNYIPKEFLPLPTFGPLLGLEVPADVNCSMPFPYVLGVSERGPDFKVTCSGRQRAPFSIGDLRRAVERVAYSGISDPDRPISSISV